MPLFVMVMHRSKNIGEIVYCFRAGITLIVWMVKLTGVGFRDG